jgi:hypothetical protein
MLDYPSEVSLWMVGIKKLIHELINMKESQKNKEEATAAAATTAVTADTQVSIENTEIKTES